MKLHLIPLCVIAVLSLFLTTLDRVTSEQNNQSANLSKLKQLPKGKIAGIVTDLSGAVIAGVRVSLSTPSGFSRSTTTNDNGYYEFNNVRFGTYSLKFFSRGRSFVRNVRVSLKETITVSPQLGPAPTPTPTPRPSPRPTLLPIPTPTPSLSPSPRPTSSSTPTPSPMPLPSPHPSPSPAATPPIGIGPDWDAEVARQEQQLRLSKIVFNPPAEMQEQKTEIIQARISREDIGPALAEGLQGPGKPHEESLKASETMKVSLTGDRNAFLIQVIGDEEKAVGRPYAQWEWHVTPLQSGDQKLTLTATAIIFLEGRGEKAIHYKTLEKQILVHVDRWYASRQFIANNWQWLWAVVIVPAVGVLWGMRKRKRRRAEFK